MSADKQYIFTQSHSIMTRIPIMDGHLVRKNIRARVDGHLLRMDKEPLEQFYAKTVPLPFHLD